MGCILSLVSAKSSPTRFVLSRILSGCLVSVLVFAGGAGYARANSVENTLNDYSKVGQTIGRSAIDGIAEGAPYAALIRASARCDVEVYRINYNTAGPRGEAATASAALYLPSDCPGPYAVGLYVPGTEILAGRTFAQSQDLSRASTVYLEQGMNLVLFASQGDMVVVPDNLGLGESDFPYHPYLNAESEAQVSIDALRAALQVLGKLSGTASDKLFVYGGSQGGHSAAATLRALERDFAEDFSVTAAVAMMPPLALEVAVEHLFKQPGPYTELYLSYAITGYQKAYGDIYATPSDVFQPPYDKIVESLFPGQFGLSEFARQRVLPAGKLFGAGGLFQAAVKSDFVAQSGSLRRVIRDNDLRHGDWLPAAPIAACGWHRDRVVPFSAAREAISHFNTRGAKQAILVEVEEVEALRPLITKAAAAISEKGDSNSMDYHFTAFMACMVWARDYFASHR